MKSLVEQIFSWDGWEVVGTSILYFNIELNCPMGSFQKGHKFNSAFVNSEQSILSLIDENDIEYIFNLKLSVG